MADRTGQQAGNYRLIRLLGYGGFAEVYLGQHIYLEKFAAIKILHTQLAAADIESFQMEARTIANLEHSHIVRVLEFGIQEQGHTPYLVMEYAPNGSLRERHPKGTILPLPAIVTYVNQAAAALYYAHQRNLIHRDIKPENMLVGQNNNLLLSDFGIALIAQTSRSQSTQDVVGSVAYMAPEQLQGRPRFASDQYSLGITVYEWLCGDRPFHGNFTEIASQHIFTPPPSLREKIPWLSPAIEEVVAVALAKDYQSRFANIQAFANALEQACRSQASTPPFIASSMPGLSSASFPPAVAGSPSISLPPTLAASPSAPFQSASGSLPPTLAASPSISSPPTAASLPPTVAGASAPPMPPTVTGYPASSIPLAGGAASSPDFQGGTSGFEQSIQRVTQPASYQQAPPANPPGTFDPGTVAAPQPRKRPNVGLLIGTAVMILALIAGSFFVFNRGNTGTSNNAPGATGTSHPGTTSTPTTRNLTSTPGGAAVTVALVTDVGGLNDDGFNQMAYMGYENARKQYGFPDVVIQSTTISDSEYINKLTEAAQRADMVIGIGFDMETAIAKVAQQFPNKRFAIVDGCAVDANFNCLTPAQAPNVAPLFFKEQEAGCLVGALAGKMEADGQSQVPKLLGSNTIAAIGGQSIPPVNRYIAGYKYCAKMVDPGVTVLIKYSNDFSDSTKCKSAALNLIANNHADILFQVAGGCGIGVLNAATQQNVFSIGIDSDQSKDATGAIRPSVITSAVKRVDTAVSTIIQLAQLGTFASFVNNPFKFDIAHDGVGFAKPSSDVPQDAVQTAMSFANQIKSGTLIPPENIPG